MNEQFPILYGRRITNSHEFVNVQAAVMRDLLAGKISVKEANAVARDSRKILKMFRRGSPPAMLVAASVKSWERT
ncbi:MAG: hypothetical protein WA728_14545 [Xanthobacteraceae bacterium]